MSSSSPCLAILTAAVVAIACGSDQYRGDVYPDATNTHRRIFVGNYETLNDCRTGARAVLVALRRYYEGFYECGKNCRPWPVTLADTLWHCQLVTEVHGENAITRE